MWIVVACVAGVLGWSFLEYAIHRFVAHVFTFETTFRREHLRHHRERNYYASTGQKARLAAMVTAALGVVSVPVVGWVHGAAFTLSLVATYLVYEWVHRDLHVRAPWGAYGRWARRHHLHHHHADPNMNHGVTSPLWDWVFGTLAPTEVVRIPQAKRPDWMTDDAQGPWRADYELVAPRGAKVSLPA